MMRPLPFLFLVCSLFSFHAVSQTRTIDSLKRGIATAKNAEEKLDMLLELCEQRNSLSPDALYSFASEARSLAVAHRSPERVLLAGYYIAASVEKRGLLDSALALAEREIKETAHDTAYIDIQRKFIYLKGTTLLRRNKYKEALSVFFTLLHQAEQTNDTFSQVAAKGAIGWTYMEINQQDEALAWFRRTLQTTSDPSYEKYFVATYINMAAVHGMLGQFDSVERFVNRAIQTARETEQLTFLCNALNLKAALYMHTNRNALAERPLNEALEIRMQIGDPFYIVADLAQLSGYYSNERKTDKAISLARQGIALAEQYRMTSKLPMLYDALAHAYKLEGDLDNYSKAINKYIGWKDSIYNINSAEAIAGLNAKYQLQKKENMIILQQLELVKRNYLLIGSAAFIVLVSIAGFLSFKNYRKKQRMKLERMKEEEKVSTAKAVKDAEESERKRIAADLHDNLGAYAASIAYNLEHAIQYTDTKHIAMEELRNNAQAMVSELSDTIWALKKDALLLTAISDRVKVFLQRIQNTFAHISMDVEEEISNDILLSPSQAFHLLKMIQEAINNAVKHSGGSRLTVRIEGAESWRITIADNGTGIGNEPRHAEGNGLYNMRMRAEVCGWDIRWNAAAGSGTSVTITAAVN